MAKKMTEEQTIEAAQDALVELKGHLKALQAINTDEGRGEAANATFGIRGALDVWHSDATKALYNYYPSLADGISTRAGGR